jgi:hypothetical protein
MKLLLSWFQVPPDCKGQSATPDLQELSQSSEAEVVHERNSIQCLIMPGLQARNGFTCVKIDYANLRTAAKTTMHTCELLRFGRNDYDSRRHIALLRQMMLLAPFAVMLRCLYQSVRITGCAAKDPPAILAVQRSSAECGRCLSRQCLQSLSSAHYAHTLCLWGRGSQCSTWQVESVVDRQRKLV